LEDGSIAVSDTGNRRVQVFSPDPFTLLAVIRLAAPWGLAADECGNLYVADRARGAVLKFYRDGSFRGSVLTGLGSPGALARSRAGTLAVLDGQSIVTLREGRRHRLEAPSGAVSIAIDAQESLYAGTEDGLIARFVYDGKDGYRAAGDNLIGRDAAVRQMLFTQALGLLVAAYPKCESRAQLLRVRPDGASAAEGSLLTAPLDSGLEKCAWHRVELDADIPSGCSIEVTTQTAERDVWTRQNAPFEPAQKPLSLREGQTECLVQSEAGRFLRLRLRFLSNSLDSPRLRSIRLHFPRDSYLKYLPAIYQEDAESRFFLERFLSIFQTTFDARDRQIDNISDLFEPLATPEKVLPWLAGWLALPMNPRWSTEEKRKALDQASAVYRIRGTPEGLRTLIRVYTGVEASVMEHYRMRPLMILGRDAKRRLGRTARLWSRDFYARLQLDAYSTLGYFRIPDAPEPALEPLAWGAHRFSVFFLADPGTVDDTLKQVRQIVEREKPAHTEATYCPVFPRMRVGVQATVGVDTRLGVITPMVLRRTATLGYDSILGCTHREEKLRHFGAALLPGTGISTRLQ
jgi:phage tail-like protein